ncbi:OmpH family outer membrane protein [Psychroserpens sp.]|uniref:OmpH family outer membrane protein n=1 Tax=Psychroserpens sp. TaxID=2020870 RepID=UPI001B00E953|nr:OmpH family outer membrane protein [Psychroserpens sp.]MBO6607867.1 OmpH family outer membrane protein [Psychroserpens sp.]MBO6632181.1 OmpH family outer membrane protein [Psychroserpens sp.]MBO6655006.1 OmpH family outer membrane protein [Psychroserpens sp.]MBO6682920.1 OmpH family outer membrane protein [Psychroserpens sp.]MBO6751225.1 OmpH family outer membrane protein [Psychroserpens sp.]
MKSKVLFLVTIISLMSFVSNAQRSVRIGYIDTEYILQNIPEYQQATAQLDQKVQQWKTEIEQRLAEIESKKKQLNSESVLLTKELYEERMEDISFEEAEILDYQQKRFGPNGDLMIQKQQLIQPVQDQIFAAVQEIAGGKKYDFIFDKSADVVMLYSAERFDLSDLVIRSITRSSKRTQAKSRAERKQAEKEDVVPVINKEVDERQKALEEKKNARDAAIADRQAQQQKRRDSLKAAAAARRQKILDDRAKAKAERDSINASKRNAQSGSAAKATDTTATAARKTADTAAKTPQQIAEEKRQQKLKDREERKKALEERKKRILEERKKAKEEREAQKKKKDSVPNDN